LRFLKQRRPESIEDIFMPELKHILIVGVGSIGLRHLRCFDSTGRAKLSFCEVNQTLRTQVAHDYNVERHYPDLESALAVPYDAAVICTPANLHIPMAIRLAKAGIHLLLEKPLSTNLDGIDKLHEILKQQNLKSAVAYVMRNNPILRSMRDAIASGRFGRPVEIVSTSGQHFPTYRPAYRDIYYKNRATGGGAIQDALTHVLNASEWIVGPINRIAVDASHQILEGVDVEDTVHVMTRHGGVLGSYSLNQYQAPSEMTITVICDGGTARFEGHNSRWRWMLKPGDAWTDEQFEPFERDVFFVKQANAFLDLLDDRVKPLCTLEEGLQTLRVNLAALASADQGNWQTIENIGEGTNA
jgi:predicted dehydrogenase